MISFHMQHNSKMKWEEKQSHVKVKLTFPIPHSHRTTQQKIGSGWWGDERWLCVMVNSQRERYSQFAFIVVDWNSF